MIPRHFAFDDSHVIDPEGEPVRFDRVLLTRLEGLDDVPYDPRPDGGSLHVRVGHFSATGVSAHGRLTREGRYRLEAIGRDPQGHEVRVVQLLRFENLPPVARDFEAVVTAGVPFDLRLDTFRDPDPSWRWEERPVFSAQGLPPGIRLTADGRLQGRLDTVGDTLAVTVTLTDGLSGVSASAQVRLRAEAEGGGLSPRVNSAWSFLPGAAQLGEIAGPYRLVERRYLPGRAESTFGPAVPGRWESLPAPEWIRVDPTTGRLEGTPPSVGRIVLAYEVDLPEPDPAPPDPAQPEPTQPEGSPRVVVLSSFTLNVREELADGAPAPVAGPPLAPLALSAGRYFRWAMPAATLEGAAVRLDRVDRWDGASWWNDGAMPAWLRWSESGRSLNGTPPAPGRFRLVFATGGVAPPTELVLELEVRPAQSARTGTVSWPEPGLGDPSFVSAPLALHGGPNLSAWTAMGHGPAQTLRAVVPRTMPATTLPATTPATSATTHAPAPDGGRVNQQTLWFSYDGLNRVRVSQGVLNNGRIELAASEAWASGPGRQSHRNVYDSAGRVVAQEMLVTRSRFVGPGIPTQRETVLETRYFVHDLRGNVVAEGTARGLLGTPLTRLSELEASYRAHGLDERAAYFAALHHLVPEATTLRRYDDLGRLIEERELYPEGSWKYAVPEEAELPPSDNTHPKRAGDGGTGGGWTARTTLDVSGWLKQTSTFAYDADGRLLTQAVQRRDESTLTITRRTLSGFETIGTGVRVWVAAAYQEMQRNPQTSWQVEQRYRLQASTLTESTLTSFAAADPSGPRFDWRGRLVTAGTPRLGYDAAGVLHGYTVQERSGNTVRWTDTYAYTYHVQDGYLETRVSGTSTHRHRRASETLSAYDGWGRRISLEERTQLRDFRQTLRSARYFAYDAEGGLISRREGELVEERGQPLRFRQARPEDGRIRHPNPVPGLLRDAEWIAMSAAEREHWAAAANTHRYSFANGQLLGSVNAAGRMAVGDRLTGFVNSQLGTGTVVVRHGETLRSLAQRVYGDASLWYVLADANGLSNADEPLAEGQNLQVPQVSTRTNHAGTFKPYDPSEQIGPTAPSLPTIAPPPNNSCNPIAQLLMVIVAAVVTIYTAGAAATAMAGGSAAVGNATVMAVGQAALTGGGTLLVGSSGAMIAAGAAVIGGAAGSIASQVVGMATGQQRGFSWRGVATGALGAGLTAGIGSVMGHVGSAVQGAMGGTASWGQVARSAAAHALGGAAANTLTGGSFSWRQVAASAVGSVAAAAATNALFGTVQLPGGTGTILGDTATGLVGGLVSAHTRRAFGVGSVNEGRIALDAFGNALGNALVRGAEEQRREREAAEVAAQMRRERAGRAVTQLADGSFVDANGTRFGIGVGMTPTQREPGAQALADRARNPAADDEKAFHPWRSITPGPSHRATLMANLNRLFDDPLDPNISNAELAKLERLYSTQLYGSSGGAATRLPTLEVTVNEQRNRNHINAWWYSVQFGAPAPRLGMSDDELRSLYHRQRAWHQNHPLTVAHQQWVASAHRAVQLGSGQRAPWEVERASSGDPAHEWPRTISDVVSQLPLAFDLAHRAGETLTAWNAPSWYVPLRDTARALSNVPAAKFALLKADYTAYMLTVPADQQVRGQVAFAADFAGGAATMWGVGKLGAGAGAWAGAKYGAKMGLLLGPKGALAGALVGGLLGAAAAGLVWSWDDGPADRIRDWGRNQLPPPQPDQPPRR